MELAIARADAIFQDDDVVAEIARAARRAFDPAFGRNAADQDRAHAIAAQHEIEVSADKAVGAALLKNDIFGFGFERVDDVPVVRIFFFFEQLLGICRLRPFHAHPHPDAGFFLQ